MQDYFNELCHYGVKGMKWGVRRYQNKDGTLTDAGMRRLSREKNANLKRKKGKRLDDDALNDPNRWVSEDMRQVRQVADSGRQMAGTLKELNRSTQNSKGNTRMDLSSMSDQELRERINRELLERQYNNVFNQKPVSKGRHYAERTLEIGGGVLATTSSALGIALAIRDLRGR